MPNKIISVINGKKIKANKGQTILEVAKTHGIEIPSLCHHPDLKIKAACRLCVVEIKGCSCPQTACSTKIESGMKITTHSPALASLRKTNLELIFAQHREECQDCVTGPDCRLLKLAKEYNVEITKFKDRKTRFPVYKMGPAMEFDSSKCIDCKNCVEMCQIQAVNHLEIKEKNNFFQIAPSKTNGCIYCGQCLIRCPVGAFEAVGEFEKIEKPLQQKNKTVIFQFAPAIRTSIGELFNMRPGEIVTDKLVGAIKKLGADKVFDVSVGADFTTTEEAKELIEKVTNGKCKTLFSSCCPAWVRFVELYYPKFIGNLATARPPHIILGGLIKTFYAKQEKTDPNDIVVVSVMPCVAKKYEITRKELKINGMKPVDYVLTTRELARLLKKHDIDLKKTKPEKADDPLGLPSGAGVIYGASGGVMESALRTAFYTINKSKLPKINFKQVRGHKGIKTAKIKLGDKILNVAAVSGTGNAKKILDELKQNPNAYSCVEVMACPGGCIGGGGQPVWADSKIRRKRADGLYKIDKKKRVRIAAKNPIVKKVYKEYLTNEKIIKKVCHAKYTK